MTSDSGTVSLETGSDDDLPRFRESNKADKRRRIRNAAKMLFSKQGYEATTLRQIAKEAGVALGTLSLYADDKRDLVLLIFNEQISSLNDRAEAAAEAETDLLEQLFAMFSIYAENADGDLMFARIHHQLSYYSGGRHSQEYYTHRDRVFRTIERILREAKANGAIASREDPAFIAKQVFFAFSACLRWWVASQNPKLEDCLRDLRRALQFQIDGMKPVNRPTGSGPIART
jgi:AcrR family transcriptional regulator